MCHLCERNLRLICERFYGDSFSRIETKDLCTIDIFPDNISSPSQAGFIPSSRSRANICNDLCRILTCLIKNLVEATESVFPAHTLALNCDATTVTCCITSCLADIARIIGEILLRATCDCCRSCVCRRCRRGINRAGKSGD